MTVSEPAEGATPATPGPDVSAGPVLANGLVTVAVDPPAGAEADHDHQQ